LDEQVTQWSGGLPPAAHERLERQRASKTAGSLFSAPAAAAARSAGLDPVGEVFGCLVMNLGWTGGTCGYWGGGGMGGFGGGGLFGGNQQGGGFGGGPGTFGGGFGGMGGWVSPVTTSGGPGGAQSGFGPYVKAFEAAFHGAVARMLAEAQALGAEGVVGVQLSRSLIDGRAWEFTATGTAVRSLDTSLIGRPRSPGDVWAANLTAEDCTAAILSGLVPKGITLGISVSTKHEDYQLKQQRSTWSGNTEVSGLTTLLQEARRDARAQLTAHASRLGGTDLAISQSWINEFDTPCGQEVDVHAEAVFIGTVLAPGPMSDFRTKNRPGTAKVLTVIPLTDPPQLRRR
jgi:uncharacterized protein YbjQ (UPF0145 family)